MFLPKPFLIYRVRIKRGQPENHDTRDAKTTNRCQRFDCPSGQMAQDNLSFLADGPPMTSTTTQLTAPPLFIQYHINLASCSLPNSRPICKELDRGVMSRIVCLYRVQFRAEYNKPADIDKQNVHRQGRVDATQLHFGKERGVALSTTCPCMVLQASQASHVF